MRSHLLVVICFLSVLMFAKDAPKAILVSHNDIKGPIIGNTHTEDLEIYQDGRVSYREAGNDRKKAMFATKLTPRQLQRLTLLLNSQELRAVPAEIGSQIRVLDFDWEAQLNIQHGSSRQTIAIKNFYPLLNSHRPAYPKALVELECMLQDIQRRAAKRPAPTGDENWCPEALGKTR
ncbi:MAG TPA: hypothetical protein VE604_03045 [Candidatus Polarisedimenticolia bacterium]|jgi:hypothetical protein|nr:hypothetical protein [Candidatus Polarisedimenticolia bacterium]